jgi:membrane protease YdiL (CAAX protease family)
VKKWCLVGFVLALLALLLPVLQPPGLSGTTLPTSDQLLEGTGLEGLLLVESTDNFINGLVTAMPPDVLGILVLLFLPGLAVNVACSFPDRSAPPVGLPFGTGLGGALFWLITGFGGGIGLSGFLNEWGVGSFGIHWFSGFLLQFTFLVSVVLLLLWNNNRSDTKPFLTGRGWSSTIRTGIVEYLRFYPFLILALVCNELLVLPYLPPELPLSYRFLGAAQGLTQNVALFALIGLLAPITEEYFFRGIVFGSLRSRVPFWPSVLLGGGIFGLIHFEYQLFLPLWFFGAFLCYTYERTGSIKVVIIMHFLQNTVSFYMIKRLFG